MGEVKTRYFISPWPKLKLFHLLKQTGFPPPLLIDISYLTCPSTKEFEILILGFLISTAEISLLRMERGSLKQLERLSYATLFAPYACFRKLTVEVFALQDRWAAGKPQANSQNYTLRQAVYENVLSFYHLNRHRPFICTHIWP